MHLNTKLNKFFLTQMFLSLNLLENKTIYEPGQQKEVLLNKTELMLDAWRFYFQELFSTYYPVYKDNTKHVIHIIFANEVFQINKEMLNNTIFYRLAFYNIKENTYKYKDPIIKIYEYQQNNI